MSTTELYCVRFRRTKLRRWARGVPREIGASLISEAFDDLIFRGDAGALKSLAFINHVDGRRKRRRNREEDGNV